MSLDAHVVVRRDGVGADFAVDVALRAAPGEVVVLLGPNGAGKSTVLAALAGLVPLTGGRVVVGEQVYADAERGTSVRPDRRAVGYVPQDLMLFPHLSVLDNVAFGPRSRGARRQAARARALAELARLDLADLALARPRRLSGGQAQRVALARALALDPQLLLLDEPLSALDARTRVEVRAVLRRHLATVSAPTVVVTHEPLDAMVLGDRLVVVEAGRVVQDGAPAHVARRPRTDYVARLVGLNLLAGESSGGVVTLAGGARIVAAERLDGPVHVAFPPTAVSVHTQAPHGGSARNVWPGTVAAVEPHGSLVRVQVEGPVPLLADVTPPAVAELGLRPGLAVWASVKAVETSAYPR
jgi:molybdate transport system ATP-binding protein